VEHKDIGTVRERETFRLRKKWRARNRESERERDSERAHTAGYIVAVRRAAALSLKSTASVAEDQQKATTNPIQQVECQVTGK
jgi:hypothetical protein